MRAIFMCLAFVLAAGCGATTAERSEPRPERKMQDIGTYLEFQEELREGFENGRYGDLNDREMELLIDSQRTLESTLAGAESIDDLGEDQRIEVFNAQEAINAIIRGNVEDRPICRRQVKTIGTNIRKTECYTAAQREEMLQLARRLIESAQANSHLGEVSR